MSPMGGLCSISEQDPVSQEKLQYLNLYGSLPQFL